MTGQARDRFFNCFVRVPTKQSFFTRHLPFTPENGPRIRGLSAKAKNRPRSGVSGILQGFYYPIRNFSNFFRFFLSPKKCTPALETTKVPCWGTGFFRFFVSRGGIHNTAGERFLRKTGFSGQVSGTKFTNRGGFFSKKTCFFRFLALPNTWIFLAPV